jgi:prepilin-type N-terminal cleavage/methylation domain-containing protein
MRVWTVRRIRGFTLVELVIVIVVVGVLVAYAAMNGSSSASAYTVLARTQKMASGLRHAQSLAVSLGTGVRVSVVTGTNGSYSVACLTRTTSPCSGTAGATMTDPATGQLFQESLGSGVVLGATASTLDIASNGNPGSTGATYTISSDTGSTSKSVVIVPITGTVQVQ